MHFPRDLDGSLTGTDGNTILFNDPNVIDPQCDYIEEWDMVVCPPEMSFESVIIFIDGWFYAIIDIDGYFQFHIITFPKFLQPGSSVIVREKDGLSYENTQQNINYFGQMQTDSHVVHFLAGAKDRISVRATGLDKYILLIQFDYVPKLEVNNNLQRTEHQDWSLPSFGCEFSGGQGYLVFFHFWRGGCIWKRQGGPW